MQALDILFFEMPSFRSRRNFLTAGPAAVAGVAPLMGKPAKRALGAMMATAKTDIAAIDAARLG